MDTIPAKVDPYPSSLAETSVYVPCDPNEIIGTKGYDALGDTMQWVAATASLPYTIYFENDPELATAAAQKVEVRHRLHTKADISTFAIGAFGFGSHVFTVEGNRSSYQQRLDLTADMGIYVDVVAGIDIVANEVFWIFQSIDPATGLPPQGTQQGFLPVNDENHSGEGYVSFTIKPKSNACATGDVVTASASIIFDINEAIPTNVWHNMVDALPPTTQLSGTDNGNNEVLLQFSGQDDEGGCGIKQYKLYVSDNYGAYILYDTYPAGSEATFLMEYDHCYRFFCLGEDNVGNVEEMKEEAEYEYGNYDLIVTVVAVPEEGGTVTGGGAYDYGETVTLSATANGGYTFVNWMKGGAIVSTEATYSFTMTGSCTYIANFEYDGYLISSAVSPVGSGYVIGGGTYPYGQICTLTAVANPNYVFDHWVRNGIPIDGEATIQFAVTGRANYVAYFNSYIFQNTNFAQGWNWWSIYVEANNLLEQLESGLGSNGQTIKSQNGYVQYMPDYNIWYGSTDFSINNESRYLVQTSEACAVEITGIQADPANHPIMLSTGWNWIGYPCSSHMSFVNAFSDIIPSNGDQVKSQSHGYASYMAEYGIWYGTLADYGIDPGMGLMYKSNNGSSFSFTYPNGRYGDAPTSTYFVEDNHWTADYNAYPNNMTVTAVVELDDVELNGDNYELAAFADGECRGSVRLMYVAPLNRYMAFLTIAGDETAELTFGLYNTENGAVETVCTPSLQYETNAVVGSLETPYVIRFRSTMGVDDWANSLHVFPNPVARGEQFTLGLTANEIGKVQIEIINALGVVETLRAASVQTITAPDVAGVYTLRITVEGKGTCYRKLVVR